MPITKACTDPIYLITDSDESDTSVVDLVILLLKPVESSVTFSVLQALPVFLATALVLEEFDRLTFALLRGED